MIKRNDEKIANATQKKLRVTILIKTITIQKVIAINWGIQNAYIFMFERILLGFAAAKHHFSKPT